MNLFKPRTNENFKDQKSQLTHLDNISDVEKKKKKKRRPSLKVRTLTPTLFYSFHGHFPKLILSFLVCKISSYNKNSQLSKVISRTIKPQCVKMYLKLIYSEMYIKTSNKRNYKSRVIFKSPSFLFWRNLQPFNKSYFVKQIINFVKLK